MSDDEFVEYTAVTAAFDLPSQPVGPAALNANVILRQVKGPHAPCDRVLDQTEHTVGRSSKCDVSIDSPELSRQHIRLVRVGPEYEVHDLDSRNGVYLNGVKIHRAILRGGDMIQIGNVSFLFIEGF